VLLEPLDLLPFNRGKAGGRQNELRGKKEFVVLIHLPTQLVTNWFVNKPFTL